MRNMTTLVLVAFLGLLAAVIFLPSSGMDGENW